jgi:hypothetical protein
MPHYTVKYTVSEDLSEADDFLGPGANKTDVVQEINNRYKATGKIVSSDCTESNGTYIQMISFDTTASYNEWYAEIDAVDTTPPAGVTYVGTGVYAD